MKNILDGKLISLQIKAEISNKCSILKEKYGITAKLAIVLVGDNPASQIYVASKERSCNEVGIQSVVIRLDKNSSQEQVEKEIAKLATDESVNAIMVQLPLPKGLCEQKILNMIPSHKDVDGLTIKSGGECLLGYDGFTPCTPKGIMEILKRYDVNLSGKNAVVVGRSNMVGKPIALKLLEQNCSVSICHSKTNDLKSYTKNADILIVAVGKKHLITADMVKKGAVVVDVGINREDGKIYGDVDFDAVKEIAALITPVPGGVGPMTVAMLLDNTIEACIKQNKLSNEL